MSGSIPKSKHSYINKIAPIVDSISTQEAVEMGLVSPFVVINFPVKLDIYERASYNTLTASIDRAREYGHTSWKKIGQRRQLLSNSHSKLGIIKEISEFFAEEYGIIFSEFNAFSDEITRFLGENCVSFHSGIAKKDRAKNMKSFTDGRTKINRISTVKALNEGANIPRLVFAIIAAGTSKEKDLVQRLGRAIRFEEGKKAYLIRLFVENSQEELWVARSQERYDTVTVQNTETLFKLITDERSRKSH